MVLSVHYYRNKGHGSYASRRTKPAYPVSYKAMTLGLAGGSAPSTPAANEERDMPDSSKRRHLV